MSLFSAVQVGRNAMMASQLGLQVVGNNIANANTEGYIRESLVLAPAPTQRKGDLLLGLGVDVKAVTQRVDRFLQERLRNASSDKAHGEALEGVYLQLESVIGELGDTDLSTSIDNFFGSLNDILNQPESESVRNLAALLGDTLASDLRRLRDRVAGVREGVNTQVINAAKDMNRLLEEISRLNVQIVSAEGGGASQSDAVGLRDSRDVALARLSELIGIRTTEQPDGSVTVFVGGDFVVWQGEYRAVEVTLAADRGLAAAAIQIAETDVPLSTQSGKLGGLIRARDEALGGFLDSLDAFASTLIYEFNKMHSSGQGLTGYTQMTSEFPVENTQTALDSAGLTFSPTNGSLTVHVLNRQTGLTQTTDILVPLNGLDDDLTLEDLAAALDEVDGLSASITVTKQLRISADSPLVEFAFADDTSGVLAALGLGGFFTGSDAATIGVNETIKADPTKFAASKGGIGADTENAVELAGFLDKKLETAGAATLGTLYDGMISETTQAAAVSRSVAEGFRVFELTLEGQHLALSGVSLDEEAINMIVFQRMFQAAARFVTTVSEMLDVLVNI